MTPRTARGDSTNGCIRIVVDDDPDPTKRFLDAALTIDQKKAAQKFYTGMEDVYDFILFFPNFDGPGSNGRPVGSTVQGLGPAGTWGAPGAGGPATDFGSSGRLQGVSQYRNYTTWPADPEDRIADRPGGNDDSALSLIAQEVGHRWGTFVRHATGDTRLIDGWQTAHWSYYTHSPSVGPRGGHSSLMGNWWRELGGNQFTPGGPSGTSQTDGFSQLDLYLMGLLAPEAVAPFFFIDSPTDPGGGSVPPADNTESFRPGADTPFNVNGTKVDVTIDDIIATNGARAPTFAASQKNFKMAFVILAQDGTTPSQAQVDQLETYRAAWESYFAQETGGLGSTDACVDMRPVDVVFLLDISGSFLDDLPVFKTNVEGLVDDVLESAPGSRFALASFKDFPFFPYGCDGQEHIAPTHPFGSCNAKPDVDYAYRLDLALTGDKGTFLAAVNGLPDPDPSDGADGPQSQYEAIFQVLTGAGRSLGQPGGLGDIPASSIYPDGDPQDRPLFIFLFTDASMHDSDVDTNYPVAGAPAAGRTSVLGLLQNTPFVFGMVAPGGDTPQLREITDLTGGDVVQLEADSSGFDDAIEEAIESTEPEPIKEVTVLSKLSLRRTRIDWRRHRDSHVRIEGIVELPSEVTRRDIESMGQVEIIAAEHPVLAGPIDFDVERRHGHSHEHRGSWSRWGRRGNHHDHVHGNDHGHGHDHDRGRHRHSVVWEGESRFELGRVHMRIEWLDLRKGRYTLTGNFSTAGLGLHGDREPQEFAFGLSLGAEPFAAESRIFHNQWRVQNRSLWLGPNGEAPDSEDDQHFQDPTGLDDEGTLDDSPDSAPRGCNIVAAGGRPVPGSAAFVTVLSAFAFLTRRRRSRRWRA